MPILAPTKISCGLYLGLSALRRGSTVVVVKQFCWEALAWEPATPVWPPGCSAALAEGCGQSFSHTAGGTALTLRHQSPSPCFRWQFPERFRWGLLHCAALPHICSTGKAHKRSLQPWLHSYYSVTPMPYLPSVTSSFIWVSNVITLVWSNQPAQFSNF